jgi:riboflavin biosynthesis pyrimidine reductase
VGRLAEFSAQKIRAAETARLFPLRTVLDSAFLHPTVQAGNAWSRRLYDGPFHLWRVPSGSLPAMSLVFVQSRDGNTSATDPADLGGGETDRHLLYEGLSRVAADAVLAGTTTVSGEEVFFSVWHPELVSLRKSYGLPRHPAQILLTKTGRIAVESTLVLNIPEARVFVLGTPEACDRLGPALGTRPWVTLISYGGEDVIPALEHLRAEYGIRRISVVGGRTVATALLDAGVIQDVYLTTTEKEAGEPGTPLYGGSTPPTFDAVVRKRGTDADAPFLFEHLGVYRAPGSPSSG